MAPNRPLDWFGHHMCPHLSTPASSPKAKHKWHHPPSKVIHCEGEIMEATVPLAMSEVLSWPQFSNLRPSDVSCASGHAESHSLHRLRGTISHHDINNNTNGSGRPQHGTRRRHNKKSPHLDPPRFLWKRSSATWHTKEAQQNVRTLTRPDFCGSGRPQ